MKNMYKKYPDQRLSDQQLQRKILKFKRFFIPFLFFITILVCWGFMNSEVSSNPRFFFAYFDYIWIILIALAAIFYYISEWRVLKKEIKSRGI